MKRTLNLAAVLLAVICGWKSSFAQLSPGELHQSHAFLEGLSNCGKCHGPHQQILSDNCLNCHATIKSSLTAETGLHGRNGYADCAGCHVEHQGRNYELIYWENGRKKFEHGLTGYELKGKHTGLECQKCHQPKNVTSKELLLADRRSLPQTYMGLGQDCAGCHMDEHRGQLQQPCQSCHNIDGWKPAHGFDHTKARFVLTGKHAITPCEKCHRTKTDAVNPTDSVFTQFVGLTFQLCTDCHRDAHAGKFGANCTGCHNTESWRATDRDNFDHSRTKFPLVGRHADLACEKCHKPGQPFAGLKFDKCRACHEDIHRGQFAQRPTQGACEECHSVEGFRPAKFTVEQHQQSQYPLAGAHLAVPCDGCHTVRTGQTAKPDYRFEFASTACDVCHGDPHKGSQKQLSTATTCEGCHNVESWGQIAFDHARTRFPLVGRHTTTPCRQCHSSDPKEFNPAAMKFVLANFACAECHQDAHRGQFASTSSMPPTDCARCHFSAHWSDINFDHNRDSTYKLEGAHLKVPCRGCHKDESTDSILVVRYKPLSTACKSCHDSELLQNRTQP